MTNNKNSVSTSRDTELVELVRRAVHGAAIRDDDDADVSERIGTWWKLRIDHHPVKSLKDLMERAAMDFPDPFSIEYDAEEESVQVKHPDLSRDIEVRYR